MMIDVPEAAITEDNSPMMVTIAALREHWKNIQVAVYGR